AARELDADVSRRQRPEPHVRLDRGPPAGRAVGLHARDLDLAERGGDARAVLGDLDEAPHPGGLEARPARRRRLVEARAVLVDHARARQAGPERGPGALDHLQPRMRDAECVARPEAREQLLGEEPVDLGALLAVLRLEARRRLAIADGPTDP